MPTLRIIGPGRAGRSLAAALEGRAGWRVLPLVGRSDGADSVRTAASGCDLLVLAVGDAAVADVAARVEPVATTVVAHLAGALTLDVLGPHERRASMHPLVALPDPETGAHRLASGAYFAVAGDRLVEDVVVALGGELLRLADDADTRATYHAAACVAANHLVALMGSVERIGAQVGVPLEAYLCLARCSFDDVQRNGPAAALTGPVARGDWATVDKHRAVIAEPVDRAAYDALAAAAQELVACR